MARSKRLLLAAFLHLAWQQQERQKHIHQQHSALLIHTCCAPFDDECCDSSIEYNQQRGKHLDPMAY
jgi:hypothetical protein